MIIDKWTELKETIEELIEVNDSSDTQRVCHFLLNLMNELDRQEKENGNR